jgi:protein phosphatase
MSTPPQQTPDAASAPALRLTVATRTDIGAHREENQDNFGVYPAADVPAASGRLFMVADGMGGHRGGREASTMAVEVVERAFAAGGEEGMDALLRHAVKNANEAILDASDMHAHLRGMGTTCSVLVLEETRGWTAHVGDSRIYRITAGAIELITDDHSRVAEMVRRGLLSEEEARWHPERSLLYRALGVTPDIEVDTAGPFPLTAGEQYLLCTDGLVNLVNDDEIHAITLRHDPAAACELLTDLAIRRGGYDNITIVIVRLDPAS